MESKIKILILNFNGKAFLDNCIKSVNDINYGNYSVVVIDNNSTDGSVQYVKEKYPEVEIIETKSNLMFAGGYNYFFSQALDDCFYMILNNDTIVDKEILNDFMDGVNRYGENNIYGAKILYLKDKDKIWYAGAKVNLSKGVIKHLNIRRDNSNVKLKDCMTDYVTGCCLFGHSEISNIRIFLKDVNMQSDIAGALESKIGHDFNIKSFNDKHQSNLDSLAKIFDSISKLIEKGQIADPITLRNFFEQDSSLQ